MERPGGAQIQDPDLIALTEARRAESPQDLRAAPAGRILFQPVTPLAISSTQIRALLAAGRNPRYLLPEPVLEIIRRAG
jgi:nicotinate-nucleotide adenylyltransferase